MKLNRVSLIAVLGVGMGLLLVATPSLAAETYAEVTLTYHPDEDPCITVDPDPVVIYWNQKPKKVKWVSGSGEDYYWEIEWKGSENNQRNYFGENFAISRGQTEKRSDRPRRRRTDPPKARWPYMVKVYETSANVERGSLLCELDPAVDWGD